MPKINVPGTCLKYTFLEQKLAISKISEYTGVTKSNRNCIPFQSTYVYPLSLVGFVLLDL